VLIATAFVHLLPTAFVSLTDPCLGYIWRRYRPMAGLIAMVSALIVVGIEQLLRTRGIGHSHSHGEDWDAVSTEDHEEHHRNGTTRHAPRKSYGLGKHRPTDIALGDMESTLGLVDNVSPYPEPSPAQDDNGDYRNEEHQKSDDDNDSDLDLNELDPTTQTGAGQERQRSTSPPAAMPEEEQKKRYLQCMLLEAGILFHSVFIGMAVSVATGTPFVIFLIAIAFHQSFEGLALGSRIAQVGFPRSSWCTVLTIQGVPKD
jgi:zinc transporter 1/2/3